MKKILILGAGGHGRVVLDLILSTGKWEQISFLDTHKVGQDVFGYPVIGSIEAYKELKEEYEYAIVAMGNNAMRLKLIDELLERGYQVPVLIHPSAIVSRFAHIEAGTVILPQVAINAGAKVGKGCILNTGAIVEHDCGLGDGVHLAPASKLGGTVNIGDLTWVGLGASVIHNINIGQRNMIAAGAVVVRDIPDDVLVAGVPGRIKME